MPSVRQPVQFSPGFVHRFGDRSGCEASRPESTSATTTDGLPVPCCQACTAPMSSPAVPVVPFTFWPVLLSAHSWLYIGSLGLVGSESVCSTAFRST